MLTKNKYDEYLSLNFDYNNMIDNLSKKVQSVLKRVYTDEQINLLSIHYNYKTNIFDIRFRYPENICNYVLKEPFKKGTYTMIAIMPNYKIINVLNNEIVETKKDTVDLIEDCDKSKIQLNKNINTLLNKLQKKIFFKSNIEFKLEYCKNQLELVQLIEKDLILLGSILSEGLITRLVHELKVLLDNMWNGFEVVENHQTELLFDMINDLYLKVEGKEFK